MSVSVFNPMRLSEFHRMKFPDAKMHHAQRMTPSLDRVRRDLFGPVDREECNRFAEEELAKHQMAASERWGFDFVRGKPMEDTKLFLWERVPPTNDIPEMYTLSRAAHIRHIDADHQMRSPSKRRQYRTSSYIDLLDERSEQSNNHIAASNVLDLSFEDVDAGHSSASSCDEESFDERTAAVHYDKMLMDTTNENDLNCTSASSNSSILSNASQLESCQPTDVRLMALSMSTISAVPKSVPVTIASASVSVRRANNVNAPTASNISTTNAQSSRTSCRATNTVSRNLRSSPRNRETKRQPKITDYLKERKRLQPTPKKVSPKKARTSNEPVISSYLLRH